MRVFGILILMFFVLGGVYLNNYNRDYIVLRTQKFSVKGSTSLGKFDCRYLPETGDTLFLNKTNGLEYHIPVRGFRCGNFVLNGDFRRTLKHKEYPEVFFKMSKVRAQENGEFLFDLHLKIAGKEKDTTDLVLTKKGKELMGFVDLKFSDFDLTPPQKLGGAIKVAERINLSIILEPENELN